MNDVIPMPPHAFVPEAEMPVACRRCGFGPAHDIHHTSFWWALSKARLLGDETEVANLMTQRIAQHG